MPHPMQVVHWTPTGKIARGTGNSQPELMSTRKYFYDTLTKERSSINTIEQESKLILDDTSKDC